MLNGCHTIGITVSACLATMHKLMGDLFFILDINLREEVYTVLYNYLKGYLGPPVS